MSKRQTSLVNFFSKKQKIDSIGTQDMKPVPENVIQIPASKSTVSRDTTHSDRDPANPSANLRKWINEGPFQPVDIEFPYSGDKHRRKFCSDWFHKFKWLEYSPSTDRAFCFSCRLFKEDLKGCADKAFTETGLHDWKKAIEKFRAHSLSISHKEGEVKLTSFLSSQTAGSVICQIDSAKKREVEENKKYLRCVCQSLIFCVRQGISLRGHNESDASQNQGNFLELMKLRSQDNLIIKEFFTNRAKTWCYIGKEIQNELLNLMAEQTVNAIVKELKESGGKFAIIVDETCDISHHEQVAICVRYVTKKTFEVKESFLGFMRTEKTDASALTDLIINVMNSLELSLKDLRGQCYDGARNMSGCYSGVAARIMEKNPLAFYVHCYAHILNLCIVDVCKSNTSMRNTMGVLGELYSFIEASSKRHSIFEKAVQIKQQEFYGGNIALKSLSDTRWNCRLEACKSVLNNYDSIIDTLEEIAFSDARKGYEANSLLNNICNFEFIFDLLLMDRVLTQTNHLSQLLQSKIINYNSVIDMTEATVETLEEFRCDTWFNKLWKYASDICENKKIPKATFPRARKLPLKLGGGSVSDFSSVEQYYKSAIIFPVLDVVINSIKDRFKKNELAILQALNNVLSSVMPSEDDIKLVCETYSFNSHEFVSELKIFNEMLNSSNNFEGSSDSEFGVRLEFFKQKELHLALPILAELFQTILTIPMSSATSERAFSSLRSLKTYTRNSVGQKRLSSLAILNIENQYAIDIEKIIQTFSNIKDRRLMFH